MKKGRHACRSIFGGPSMNLSLEDRIRQRAYFLSLSGAGDETHFWLIAEREMTAEVVTESAPASPKLSHRCKQQRQRRW